MMMGHRFEGKVYPISRNSGQYFGLKAYPKISNVPEHVDLISLVQRNSYRTRCANAAVAALRQRISSPPVSRRRLAMTAHGNSEPSSVNA